MCVQIGGGCIPESPECMLHLRLKPRNLTVGVANTEMSNLHTLQILQKNTLSSLQSLIDFTNATLATPPTPAPVTPTLSVPAHTLPEDAITLQDLESFVRHLHTTESNAYKNMYGWLTHIHSDVSVTKLLTLFEKISKEVNTLLIEHANVSESKNDVITHIPTPSEGEPVEVSPSAEPVTNEITADTEEEDDDEEDDAPIQDTYDWYNGVVLTVDQKVYRQFLFMQDWKELAKRYMHALKNMFEPYFAVVNDDVTIVETHQEYKFLVTTAIHNRNKFGDILLPDTLIQWDKLPAAFLDECKKIFSSEMLFQPATFKHSIFKDVLKVYRYFNNLKGHQSWRNNFSLLKESPINIQELISNWIQEGKVTEQERDYVIIAIIFSNFCNSQDGGNSGSNYIGSNQFSQNFFAALEKTKELPNGFMNWITNGITYKHFKKVLTELGIQQVRRAEGQRYQGIRLLNYNVEKISYNYRDDCKIIDASEREPTFMENIFTSQDNQEIQPYTRGDGLAIFDNISELDLKRDAPNINFSDIYRNSASSIPAFAVYPEQQKKERSKIPPHLSHISPEWAERIMESEKSRNIPDASLTIQVENL